MPVIAEEQPVLCRFARFGAGERVLDAGTGSGVLALSAARCGALAYGIDIARRAVRCAVLNARRNGLRAHFVLGDYRASGIRSYRFDTVVFNAPHHPTAPGIKVAVHANGGEDGLQVFRAFLEAAVQHIAPGGRIVFVQLSPSKNGEPKALCDLRTLFPRGVGIRFARVLATTSRRWFLEGLYGDGLSSWIGRQVREYDGLDLVVAELTEAGDGTVEELAEIQSCGGGWARRLAIHQGILSCGREEL